MRITQAWPLVVALALGVFLGFFVVFAGVFTDGPTSWFAAERLRSFGLVIAGYFLAAIAVTRWSPLPFTRAWAILVAPAIGMLVTFVLGESGVVGLSIVYLGLAAASGFAGTRVALTLRNRSQTKSA